MAPLAAMVVYELRLQGRLKRLEPMAEDVISAVAELYRGYLAGEMNPALLDALRACAAKGLGVHCVNMQWRALCAAPQLERVLRINEAEA